MTTGGRKALHTNEATRLGTVRRTALLRGAASSSATSRIWSPRPFLASLAWAAIFALTLSPLHRRLTAPIGNTRAALGHHAGRRRPDRRSVWPPSSRCSPARCRNWSISPRPSRTGHARTRPDDLGQHLRHRIPVTLPDDPTQLIRQGAQSVAAFVAPRVGGVVANLLGMVGSIFVMLFAMFFLLRDSDRVVDMLRRVLPFPDRRARAVDEGDPRPGHCLGRRRPRRRRRSGRDRRHHVLGDGTARPGGVDRGDRHLLADSGGRRHAGLGTGGAVVAAVRRGRQGASSSPASAPASSAWWTTSCARRC